MSFNPDPTQQTQEVIFTCKVQNQNYPLFVFNNNCVEQTACQKHLGLILDSRHNFQEHLDNIFKTVNKIVGLMRKFPIILPRSPLINIYKSFIKPHLDYGGILYYHR